MSVFDEVYADKYDHLYTGKDYKSECDLIEEAIRRFSAGKISKMIDVGCGTGEHSIELTVRGYEMCGIDLSQYMINQAALKSEHLHSNKPVWVCGDARSFIAPGKYDAAIMMFAVIGYLTTNAYVIEGLRNIRKHLNKDSLFICDFWYGPSVLSTRPTDRVRNIKTANGEIVRSASTQLCTEQHTADVTFNLWNFSDDRLISKSEETHHLRYFFPKEFELFLTLSGFELLQISAFPKLDSKLSDDTWNAFVVAKAI